MGNEDTGGCETSANVSVKGFAYEFICALCVNQNEVVSAVGTILNEGDAIVGMEFDTWIRESGSECGEVETRRFYDLGVNFYNGDCFEIVMATEFSRSTAISSTNDEGVLWVGVKQCRNVCDHFVIDTFVAFGAHNLAIKNEHTAITIGVEDLDFLVFRLGLRNNACVAE